MRAIDGNDLSYTCNYKASDDCGGYETIRNGKCSDCTDGLQSLTITEVTEITTGTLLEI